MLLLLVARFYDKMPTSDLPLLKLMMKFQFLALFALYLLVTDIKVPRHAAEQLARVGDALYNFFGFIDLSGVWRAVYHVGDYFEHVWISLSEKIDIDVECLL